MFNVKFLCRFFGICPYAFSLLIIGVYNYIHTFHSIEMFICSWYGLYLLLDLDSIANISFRNLSQYLQVRKIGLYFVLVGELLDFEINILLALSIHKVSFSLCALEQFKRKWVPSRNHEIYL